MGYSEAIQELYTRWWFGGFLLPLFVSLTIGSALAIYTGWFAGRLVLFYQEMQRAREEVLSFVDRYKNALSADSEETALGALQWTLIKPVASLRSQLDQPRAAWRIHFIGARLELGGLMSRRRMHEHPRSMQSIVTETKGLQDAVLAAHAMISRIRPDYLSLGGLPWMSSVGHRMRWKVGRFRVRARRLKRVLNDEQ